MGRFVSLVTRRAAEKGSAVRLTQTLRVPLNGLMKAMNFPSGESWAPLISGSPKKSSRSRSGTPAAALGVWASPVPIKRNRLSKTPSVDDTRRRSSHWPPLRSAALFPAIRNSIIDILLPSRSNRDQSSSFGAFVALQSQLSRNTSGHFRGRAGQDRSIACRKISSRESRL